MKEKKNVYISFIRVILKSFSSAKVKVTKAKAGKLCNNINLVLVCSDFRSKEARALLQVPLHPLSLALLTALA